MLETYAYTLSVAIASTFISMILGIISGYFTSHKQFAGRRFLLSLSAVPLCVPALIVALKYISFFGINGTANKILNTSSTFLYSTFGVIVAQGFYNFPFVTGVINDAWQGLPKETENAARLLGANEKRVFFTITVKELSGAIGAACIPVFLFCFFSFMMVILFSPVGKSTLEVEIYHSIRTTLDVGSGARLALIETGTALFMVFLYSRLIKKNQLYNSGADFALRKGERTWKWQEIFVFVIMIFLIFIFLLCPLCSIVKSSFTIKQNSEKIFSLKNYKDLFTSVKFWDALKTSVIISAVSAFFCCVVSFLYSSFVRMKEKQGSALFSSIPLIPMAISSVVISWTASLIFHKSNIFVLILLQCFMYWPLAYRQVQNGMNRITNETQRAAIMLSKNKLDVLFRIYMPSCKNMLFSAFCYSFAICIGDTTMPLVLSIKGFNNLALYTYRLSSSYRFYAASTCGVLLTVLCLILGGMKNAKWLGTNG